jgi:hypothetical protein
MVAKKTREKKHLSFISVKKEKRNFGSTNFIYVSSYITYEDKFTEKE